MAMLRSAALRVPSVCSRAATLPLSSTARRFADDRNDRIHPALVDDPPVANPSTQTDPWTLKPPPMPEPPKLDPSIKSMEDLLATPHPEGRDGEPTEILRKRLVYESRKRGILETDLILGTFARERLAGMSDRELREYDRFLTLPDWTIYYYVTGKAEAPEPWRSSAVLSELLHHSANKGKDVRRMPDLDV